MSRDVRAPDRHRRPATRGERRTARRTHSAEMPAALEAADDSRSHVTGRSSSPRASLLRSKYYETIAAQAEELRATRPSRGV